MSCIKLEGCTRVGLDESHRADLVDMNNVITVKGELKDYLIGSVLEVMEGLSV